VLRPLAIACSFLTRLPLRVGEVRAPELASATRYFPIVGFGLGACGLALYALAAPWLGATVSAALFIAFMALATGGLHLDGLADWFDAVGGGRGDRSRMLEIMRDPRIGAHGASALVLAISLKLSALAELPRSAIPMALVVAPACARCAVVWLLHAYKPARDEGLGYALLGKVSRKQAWWATAFLAAGSVFFGTGVLFPLFFSALSVALLAAWANARLGGLNGDVCGAAIETAELTFLLTCRASFGAA
jgi:adenosylcobinamide-GDP ribazoletransferase